MEEDWANDAGGVDLHLDLDPRGARRGGLEAALRDAIRSGRLAPQARLPPTRVLATELHLARNTVAAAYGQLVAEGYLAARPGSGTYVTARPHRPPAAGPAMPEPPAARYTLEPGNPDVTTFPVAAWLRATRRALAAAPADAYGGGDPAGRIELRTVLADYLGRARGVRTTAERIVITSGYVQALALLTTVLGPGPVFGMEDPGLPYHREVVGRHGGIVRPVPVDGDGARLAPGLDVDAVVLTPAHQYPVGVTLHPRRRREAIEWARGGGRLLIEDDYDGEFRFDRQPVGALQGVAPDQVAYIGTASKTLAPALRLAWLVLPAHLVEPVRQAKAYVDGHTESLGQLSLAALIRAHDYDRHVRASRLRYRRRRDLLVERLGPLAERGRVSIGGIAAGLHALVGLGAGLTEEAVIARAAEQGLRLTGLAPHWHSGPAVPATAAAPTAPVEEVAHPAGLIVGYGTPGTQAYPAGLDILVRVLSHGGGRRTLA